jgi:hypothetical protein
MHSTLNKGQLIAALMALDCHLSGYSMPQQTGGRCVTLDDEKGNPVWI